jgi:hypothetical protein
MSGFQIVSLAALSVLFIMSISAIVRGRIARRVGILWAAVWAASGVAIAWPALTTRVAWAVGIRRGADLVLYCFVVFVLIGFFVTYTRLRRLDANITLLVRHLTLQNPMWPEQAPNTSTAPGQPEADEANA